MIVPVEHEEETPPTFNHASVMYVWQDASCGVSLGLHVTPPDMVAKKLDLGTVTRLGHYILRDHDAIPDTNLFVIIHYVHTSEEVHVTMLPVGDDVKREAMDAQMKTMDGFRDVLQSLVQLCRGDKQARMDSVQVLYNAPEHVRHESGGEIAVVHELGAMADPAVLASFMNAMNANE